MERESFASGAERFASEAIGFASEATAIRGGEALRRQRGLAEQRRLFAHLEEIDSFAVDFFASGAESAIGAGVSL
jgi:hypothetical protein